MTKTLDRWMPLHIADYRKDTLFLTTLQHGAYMLLLMASWEIGPLDDNETFLSSIAKVDLKTWRKDVWPAIKRFFSKTDDGQIFQKRLSAERDKAERISEIRRKNGREGGSKPKAKGKANASANAEPNGEVNALANAEAPSRDSLHTSSLRSDVPPVTPPKPDKPDPRGRRLPEDWQPSHEDRSFALGLGLNPTDIAPQFADFWHAKAGAGGRKVDWSATWRSWCRREADGRKTGLTLPNSRLPTQPQSRHERVAEAWAGVPDIEGV